MLYKLAHILRDKFSWSWNIVEWVNALLFSWRYGRRLKDFAFMKVPEGYDILPIREIATNDLVAFFQRQPEEAYTYFHPHGFDDYLENKMPVICATDPNTDMGRIAEENGYGFWCESVRPEDFTALVDKMLKADIPAMGERGYEFLKSNYTVENTYHAIMKHF